jgi:DNA-binding IclR family transcriptional regulator
MLEGKDMRANADPRMTLLFGSGTRATVLTVLANANQGLSEYRIARTGRVAQPKVRLQLHRLERGGFVKREDAGWVLTDSSLRALFLGKGRVLG